MVKKIKIQKYKKLILLLWGSINFKYHGEIKKIKNTSQNFVTQKDKIVPWCNSWKIKYYIYIMFSNTNVNEMKYLQESTSGAAVALWSVSWLVILTCWFKHRLCQEELLEKIAKSFRKSLLIVATPAKQSGPKIK